MRLWSWENYAFSNTAVTPEPRNGKCWYGIAIGPDSDEGIIFVDGHKLQAGRVLPLRTSDAYKLTRATGKAPATMADESEDSALASMRRCQVMLFETPEELAVEVSRPNGEYTSHLAMGADAGVVVMAGDGVYTRVLTMPFSGRRQAFVRVHADTNTDAFPVRVVGRRWDPVLLSVREVILVETTMTSTGGDPSEYNGAWGGVDEAECYHEIAVYVAGTAETPAARIYADGETVGEIGAR